MNHRIIHIEAELRQERHLMTQSEIVELETELQQLRNQTMSKQGETIHKQLEEILQDMPVQERLERTLARIEQYLAHADEVENLNHVNFINEIKYQLEDITNKEKN